MNKEIILPYNEAKLIIEEADVLLFRSPPFPKIGFWITKYTGGIHSHIGLAHLDDDVYIVEQREFKGGRSVLLESQIKNNKIDVYRAKPQRLHHTFVDNVVEWNSLELTDDLKKQITKTALSLTGTSYGWKNIWEIFKGYAPGFRILNTPKNGDEVVSDTNVCSTLVVYSYRINYEDPCPNLSDKRTTPADIAQSALFDYLFTIS